MRYIEVDDLADILPDVVDKLRAMGYSIGTSQAVEAVRIARSYSSLRGTTRLGEDDVVFILESVLASRGLTPGDIMDALRHAMAGKRVRERAEKILSEIEERLNKIGVKPGVRVSKKELRGRKKERREKVKAYLDLKKVGVVRSRDGVERVVDNATMRSIAWKLAREGYDSLEEAARGMANLSRDHILMAAEARVDVDRESLSRLDNRRLLSLGEAAARKGNYRLLRSVGEEVSRRILSGRRLDPDTARFILEKSGLLTPDHDKMLYMTSQGKGLERASSVDVDSIASAVESLGEEDAAILLARALKRLDEDKSRELLARVDPSLLWQVRRSQLRGEEAELLRAASYAANALREAMMYAETSNPARADMARDYIDRAYNILSSVSGIEVGRVNTASIEDMLDAASSILGIASLDSPTPGEVARILAPLGFERAVRVLRGLYRVGDERWRSIAEWALERLIYMAGSREGLRPLPRWRLSDTGPGRVDVRRSIYGMLRRSPHPMVYRRRIKANLVSLALDTSGSMQSYSIWALGMASIFARSLDRIVLFSASPRAVDGPFGRRDIARILLSTPFQGYTDIYSGILEASRSRARRLVVISDLAQTIDSGDPLDAAVKASRMGKKIVFIVPMRHDDTLRSRLEEAGFSVVIVSSPRQAARQVLRAFSR